MSHRLDAAAPRTEQTSSVPGAGLALAAPASARRSYLFSPFRLLSSAASVVGLIRSDTPAATPVATPAPAPLVPPPPPPPPPPAPLGQSTAPWVAGVLYSVVPPQDLGSITVANEELWYAVIRGRVVGVTQNQQAALDAVLGVSHNSMRGYKTIDLAVDAFNIARGAGSVQVRAY
ncbi:hypothetical protein B0H11DRAFT_2244241 [Mycena galericulata]|nr:hypothetical protein B0H11DRAFT_2244241 [Mycena galericulata]